MRIKQIDVFQVRYKLLDEKYAWSKGHAVSSFLSNIIKITTDEGLKGFSEVCPLGSAYMEAFSLGIPSGIQEIGPSLLGQDPTQIKVINSQMDFALGGHNYVKAGLDIACWDIVGQTTGLPVAELLGGRYLEEYPLYRAISQGTPEKMAEDVARFRDEGYRRFQLKVGGKPEEDIQRIKACLGVIKWGDTLVADANTGWQAHQAIRVANVLREENFYLEQPCPTLEECLAVRQHTNLPFVLDEVITGVQPFIRAYQQQAMDVVNLKISRLGGLTKARLMRDLGEKLGIVMTIEDSWGGDIATATIAHLVASTKPEFLFTSTDFNSYNDLHLADDAPRRKNGCLKVPAAPGLGLHVEEERLGEPILTIK
ncbi:MAG: cis-3-hydroxy-L-proline dehydratase [Candidatus Aminicenantales bacterium]